MGKERRELGSPLLYASSYGFRAHLLGKERQSHASGVSGVAGLARGVSSPLLHQFYAGLSALTRTLVQTCPKKSQRRQWLLF